MKQQNFFDDPKGILEQIRNQPQQQNELQFPTSTSTSQMVPQQRRRLSTFTAPSMVQNSPSAPLTTTPLALGYPSTSSLGSDHQLPFGAMHRRPKPGILRLDMSKPRRSSGGSVEFRMQPHMFGANTSTPTGTTPPSHQLSVTWATPPCGSSEKEFKIKSNATITQGLNTPTSGIEINEAGIRKSYPFTTTTPLTHNSNNSLWYLWSSEDKANEFSLSYAASNLASPVTDAFIDFPSHRYYEDNSQSPGFSIHTVNTDNNDNDDKDEDVDDEEDYSVSVSAIMQKRASVRGYRRKSSSRNSRRASSPMDHVLDNTERRRSSVYTTSSDEGTNQESTQEQIFENIRLHKEVIQSVKLQPWPIRKKLKLVRQAKTYVARHEGALQERFAMSRSTRDLWARFKIVMAARWRHWKREIYSFLTVLIPWELRIKEIESHFGSGVASYFTFLRWLMYMNVMIALPLVLFVIGPEYFGTKNDEIDPRKKMTDREYKVAGNLLTIWEFEGFLKYSPMFYGYYSSSTGAAAHGYLLPLAYFLTAVVVYIYSFVATLRKMAENSRNSKLSSKDDECTFSWKLFTGWDFMIGHAETAHNRIASVVVGFKEALLEEAEKKKDTRNWRIIMQRIIVNILIIGLLAASGTVVVLLVNSSEDLAKKDDWLSKNAVNVTMNLLSFILPMIFEALGLFENWHPRQQLRLQLARIMILNLLTLYSLMFSFIYKIDKKEKPLINLKLRNDSMSAELAILTHNWENYKAMMGSMNSSQVQATTTEAAAAIATTATAMIKLSCRNVTKICSREWPIGTNFRTTAMAAAVTTATLLNLTTSTMTPQTSTTMGTGAIETSTLETLAPWTTSSWTTTASTTVTEEYTTQTSLTSTNNGGDLWTTTPLPTWPVTDDISTTAAMSTTTTENPGNDAFEYYDYFAGMSLEDQLVGNENGSENPIDKKKRALKRNKRKKKIPGPSTIANGDFSTTLEPRAGEKSKKNSKGKQNRVKREQVPPLILRRSKYSRRDQENNEENTSTTESGITTTTTDGTTDATTLPTTTPSDEDDLFSTSNYETSTLMENLTTTTTITDSTMETTTIEPETTRKDIGWAQNDHLDNLFDFFVAAASTESPNTTPKLSPDDRLIFDDSTAKPFYLKGDDDSGHTVIYNWNDFEEGTFHYCHEMVCTEVLSTVSTNQTSTLPVSKAKALTMSQEFEKNYTAIMNELKDIEVGLTTMCWETSLGQELAKVVVLDGITATVLSLVIDFLRALFVRYVNQNWCWDMEKTFPQYGDFKIAENILGLINNQGQVWMGIFFSPGIVIINLVKLVIMMYFRSWIVLTCNVPHEVVFKASKSNNFYLSLLLTMLFLCVLPVAYAIVWLRPSWHCGPYSNYNTTSEYITTITMNALPEDFHRPLTYMASASTVIPLLLLLILIIYYLVSLTGALREANQDLKTQLQKEREEERKKFFKVPELKAPENSSTTMSNRWRKVLEASSPVSPTAQPDFESEEYKNQARKELISRIMKKALRKDSATSDEETFARHHGRDDDTDTEHHDSLPHDEDGNERRPGLSKLQEIRRTRKPSLVDIVQIANSERERVRSLRKQAHGNGGSGGKGKLKGEKAEKRPPPPPPRSTEIDNSKTNDKEKNLTDNDPDVKTRVINERRQSLLRKKKDDDANKNEADTNKDIQKNKMDEEQQEVIAVKDSEAPLKTFNDLVNNERNEREKEGNDKEKFTETGKENENGEKENIKRNGKEKTRKKDKDKDMSNEKEYEQNRINLDNQSPNDKETIKFKDNDHLSKKEKIKNTDILINADVDKDKTKDKEKRPKSRSGSPIKHRIYESFRRKKREDKPQPAKQSSLEKTNEEDMKIEDATKPPSNESEPSKKKSQSKKNKNLTPTGDESQLPSYKIVDEKSSTPREEKQISPPVFEQLQNLSGKLKFKRHKPKHSTEQEVFKFDADKVPREADIATTPTWQHLEAELQSPRSAEDVTTPTSQPQHHHYHHLGGEKFATLSRQSRKKLGSFLALMKDAVSRPDQQDPTTDTAIDIPCTPRLEMSTAFNNAFMLPVAMHTTPTTTTNPIPTTPVATTSNTSSIQPYVMPRAPLEIAEDIDPPSYSHLMMSAHETHIETSKDPEELDKPGPIVFQQRLISQRRRPIRQDSQSSNWSAENIPTITISVTPDGEDQPRSPHIADGGFSPVSPSSTPKVNVIKINIDQDQQ
ncbi:transmembrane channel-like [Haematobia irritans]|uniref:transmembrane channel-like n=1 Tax=Haematobia irritans TaxID=7368 RepID=UPI003F4F5BE8